MKLPPLVLWLALTLLGAMEVRAQTAIDYQRYVGNYRVGADHILAIAEWELDPQLPHMLAFTDLRTGRIGVLSQVGEDAFALAAGLMTGPEVARIRFERLKGQVSALTLSEAGQAPRRAGRISIRTEEIALDADTTTLHGTLWLPAGKGPFRAIALVPAGPLGRTAPATFTNFFVSQGLAVLAYDRRPAPASFQTLAADAVAAVEWLRSRPEVDSTAVGLWGHSQGGFLSLLAAAESKNVAFIIDHSGMLVPAWQQDGYRIAAEAAAEGTDREVVAEALAFHARMMRVAESGEGWHEVERALATSPPPAWHALVYKPSSLAELQRIWREDFSFDPRPFASRVRQPVLALFGGLDRSTPIESAAYLARTLGPRGKLTIKFFPTANHAFLDAKTGGNSEISSLTHFAPGMFESMGKWLGQQRKTGGGH